MSDTTERSGKAASLSALTVAIVLTMTLWFSASAVVPQLRIEWGLDDGRAAWLTMSVQLGFVVGALVSAFTNLADRVPGQHLIAAASLLGASANALIAGVDVGPAGAVALRFVTGFALAGVYPPGMKLVASWSQRDRGLAIGLLVGAITLGSALPHLFNATTLFGPAGLPPWRTVLGTSSVLATGGAVLVLWRVRPGPHLARSAPFDWRFAARAFTNPAVRLANIGYLGHMWELYAMWTWVPLCLIQSYEQAGLPLEHARLAGFGVVAIGALGSLVAGLLADRVGRTLVAGTSLLVSGLCCCTAGLLFDQPLGLTVLCLIWGFAVVADSAQFSAAISELADERYVGTALTMQTCLGFLLTLVTIQAVPPLVERLGWERVFIVLALGPLAGVSAMIRLRCRPEAERMASGRR